MPGKVKHGHSPKYSEPTSEYSAWHAMKQRCGNPNHKHYKYYGGRGIKYWTGWKKFEHFLEDMGLKPTPEHTLERIDGDKNYVPGNVKWATRKEQANNRRGTVQLTYKGKTMCAANWAREVGLEPHVVRYRIRNGWPVSEALERPTMSKAACCAKARDVQEHMA